MLVDYRNQGHFTESLVLDSYAYRRWNARAYAAWGKVLMPYKDRVVRSFYCKRF
jgi:hypothetical protein